MQYVQLDVVRYAVMILAAVDKAGQRVLCEVGPHEEPAAYLIPDAPPPAVAGRMWSNVRRFIWSTCFYRGWAMPS
jgi:hypothetical protein